MALCTNIGVLCQSYFPFMVLVTGIVSFLLLSKQVGYRCRVRASGFSSNERLSLHLGIIEYLTSLKLYLILDRGFLGLTLTP